ncbi:MAG: hypothetical protein CVU13_07355 [Bacteroidetes bacterium HGW-Bacteroidetes-8]|jgi:hypothetical protein|nr:MAG: hypothetical protein CVU13_07355 [Bacteroidetes bacterium HGW-Bacteroidetes-8]
MKTKYFLLLLVPFLFISTIALAKLKVEVSYVKNTDGVRTGCNYRVYEVDPSGNEIHLGNFQGPCPTYSKVSKNFTVDVSSTSEFGKTLLNAGIKKADLKNFVIPDFDPNKIPEHTPARPARK